MRALIVLTFAALPMACSGITHRGVEIPREKVLSVAEAQRFLNVAGYGAGRVDGVLGPDTQAALTAFSVDQGLPEAAITPELSHRLERVALHADTQPGFSPDPIPEMARIVFPSVSTAQRRLRELGYQPGPVDGILGPRTAAALRAFQTDRGLPQTGRLTPDTMAALQAPAG